MNETTFMVASQRTGATVTVSLACNPNITKSYHTTGTTRDIAAGSTVNIRGFADASGTVQATPFHINPTLNSLLAGGLARSLTNGR